MYLIFLTVCIVAAVSTDPLNLERSKATLVSIYSTRNLISPQKHFINKNIRNARDTVDSSETNLKCVFSSANENKLLKIHKTRVKCVKAY